MVRNGAGRWAAALGTAPVLRDAYQLQVVHNIMADPLFEALLVAALVVLAWPGRPGWVAVAVAGLLLGLATTVRQVGEVMVVPLLLYAVLAGGQWWRRAGLGVLALLCFLLPVAGYADWYHGVTGRYALSHAGGNALYARVAVFVDCTGLRLPVDEQILCPNVP